jgi:hypothetical protein
MTRLIAEYPLSPPESRGLIVQLLWAGLGPAFFVRLRGLLRPAWADPLSAGGWLRARACAPTGAEPPSQKIFSWRCLPTVLPNLSASARCFATTLHGWSAKSWTLHPKRRSRHHRRRPPPPRRSRSFQESPHLRNRSRNLRRHPPRWRRMPISRNTAFPPTSFVPISAEVVSCILPRPSRSWPFVCS